MKNIFTLCKRENIKSEFEDAMSEDGDYINLLEQVSKEVTLVFRKIWKDFKDTSIELIPNGDEILIKVCNKTKYSFEDRSDGFKKFISILLMLSTQSRSNKIHEKDIVYFGTLVDSTHESILYNINKTSGKYIKPAKNNRQKEHWYLFEYLSKGYKYGCYDHKCGAELVRLEAQLVNYSTMIDAALYNVKGINQELTFIEGSSYEEAIRKGLVPPPEIIVN